MITFTYPQPDGAAPWQANVHGVERQELNEESLGWLHARAFIAAHPPTAATVDLQYADLMSDLLARMGRPLTAESDPAAEFQAWRAARREDGPTGDEMTLKDFEHAVLELKSSRAAQFQER